MTKNEVTCIIIDDEKLAREVIKNMLVYFPNIKILSECTNGFEGIKAIQELKPDIIFLDVQMPKLTGFEMLELLDKIPEIIFTTAFDQYALKAFEVNAIDYLLKPFSEERFQSAVNKAIERLNSSIENISDKKFISAPLKSDEYLQRIVVKKNQKIFIISIDDIQYLEAQDDYIMFHSLQGKFLKKGTMNYYENILDPKYFIRIHRSYILRVELIKHIEPYGKDSFVIILDKDTKLPLSKNKFQQIKNYLSV